MDRKLYETPILYENLRQALSEVINSAANDSGLMMCEIEPIVKDIYSEVRQYTQIELNNAHKFNEEQELQQKQENDNAVS